MIEIASPFRSESEEFCVFRNVSSIRGEATHNAPMVGGETVAASLVTKKKVLSLSPSFARSLPSILPILHCLPKSEQYVRLSYVS